MRDVNMRLGGTGKRAVLVWTEGENYSRGMVRLKNVPVLETGRSKE